MEKRQSGILLHITSLPSPYGIGDLGSGAYQFVDFLSQAKQRLWQILPLNPTDLACGNSPYSSISAFGCNVLLISPEMMIKDGWVSEQDLGNVPDFSTGYVDYEKVTFYKNGLFDVAFQNFKTKRNKGDYDKFSRSNAHWLDDFALFVSVKRHFGGQMWNLWPEDIRHREKRALEQFQSQLAEQIEKEKFLQFLFLSQWFRLKDYANRKGIQIIGDIPIYVNYDSVDVWVHPEIFKLDENKQPISVAGVPPDYFSQTGQLWGNPVYAWKFLRKNKYNWWIRRLEQNFKIADIVRIDHFRGLVAFWEVPFGEQTAVNGQWSKVPIHDFIKILKEHFRRLPIIAEDLGFITDDVKAVIKKYNLPGMKILLFGFDGDLETHPYLPHNFIKECVVYTGTHDNNTVLGWYHQEASPEAKSRIAEYLHQDEIDPEKLPWNFICLLMKSVAQTVIIPLQDVLGLGEEARMNIPGTTTGNWKWRFAPENITSEITKKLALLMKQSKRL